MQYVEDYYETLFTKHKLRPPVSYESDLLITKDAMLNWLKKIKMSETYWSKFLDTSIDEYITNNPRRKLWAFAGEALDIKENPGAFKQ